MRTVSAESQHAKLVGGVATEGNNPNLAHVVS